METTGCKSCSENVKTKTIISYDEINTALEKLSKIKRIRFVDDETYKFRISRCTGCKYLEFGTTCLQCGCIVQIRAKLEGVGCPFPKCDMWKVK